MSSKLYVIFWKTGWKAIGGVRLQIRDIFVNAVNDRFCSGPTHVHMWLFAYINKFTKKFGTFWYFVTKLASNTVIYNVKKNVQPCAIFGIFTSISGVKLPK